MLETVKNRIRRPRLHNPFTYNERGEAIHTRLASLDPDEAKAEYETYDDITKQLYGDYLSAIDNREFAKTVLGVTLVGGLVTGLVIAITNDTDDDDDDDDDDEDDIDEEDDEDES